MFWIELLPFLFYLISTSLLSAPKLVWPTLLPAHKQGFATQVRDLKLEAHDHNVDNELDFAGTFFSTDAANRSDWLPAWGMICLNAFDRVRFTASAEYRFFFNETFRTYLRNSLKASVLFSFSGIFVIG